MKLSGNRSAADRQWGLVTAFAVMVLAIVCSSGEPSPALWEDLSIAAGVRPAMPTCNSLWFVIASPLLRWLPDGIGSGLLWLLGPLTLGFFVYFSAGIQQMLLPTFLRRQLAERGGRALIRRFVVLPVAALLCLSEPVWRLGQFFTPDTLHVLLVFLGFYGVIRFRRTMLRRHVIMSYIALGLLSVEDPLGFVLLVAVTVVMTTDAFAVKSSGGLRAVTDATLYAFLQRLLTIVALVSLCTGIYIAGAFFVGNGGLEACETKEHQAIIDFFLLYFRRVPAIATKGGWIYFAGLGIVPLAIVLIPLQRAMDIEKILDYRLALCYIGAGLLSFLQLSNFPIFWLWQSNKGPDPVSSPLLLAITMAFCAVALAHALSVLLVEVFFRHYERFEQALFFDAPDGFVENLEKKVKRDALKATWVAAISVPYILVILSLGWRPNSVERGMYRAVGDFVRLAADDCEGSPVVITDGSADAALELEMFRRGWKNFKALSMMGDRTPRETYLRRRGEVEGSEDWIALGISSAGALRDWVRMKSDRSTNLTVQIGFELWRRDRLGMPPMGATAGRTDGFLFDRKTNLVASAYVLGKRMLELAEKGAPNVTSDALLRQTWNFALWRLSRAARMRSDEADRGGNAALALRETEFADSLDDVNIAYQEVRRRTEWVPRQIQSRFTPREGLRFALQQADFTLASTYARQILAKDENDFHANFAMGMYYVTGEQYSRAAKFLEKAHQQRPKEPSSLNNLATVEMHLGRLDKAREHAEEALKLAPEVPEVKRTVQSIMHEIERTAEAGDKGRLLH